MLCIAFIASHVSSNVRLATLICFPCTQYFMFYEGVASDGGRSIGVAVSRDGLRNWRRCPEPVLQGSGEAGAWDAGAVGCPWAVSMAGGRWRLYYSGRPQRGGGAWRGIGMARSVEGGPSFEGAPLRFARYEEQPQHSS